MAAVMAPVSDQSRNCSSVCDVSSSVRRKYLKRKHQKYRKSKKRRKARKEMAVVSSPFGEQGVHSSWFWQNYHNVMEWQSRHQVAYWRSRTIALEQENCLLHDYIRSLSVGDGPKYMDNVSGRSEHSRQHIFKVSHRKDEIADNRGDDGDDDDDDYDDERQTFSVDDEEDEEVDTSKVEDNFEFEITEELLNFFEQSIRHKMELKKQKEEENSSQDENQDGESSLLPPVKQVGQQRQEEMKLLYGKAAPMIVGMETALQLSFDRNCDLKQPKLWPNIPLKL